MFLAQILSCGQRMHSQLHFRSLSYIESILSWFNHHLARLDDQHVLLFRVVDGPLLQAAQHLRASAGLSNVPRLKVNWEHSLLEAVYLFHWFFSGNFVDIYSWQVDFFSWLKVITRLWWVLLNRLKAFSTAISMLSHGFDVFRVDFLSSCELGLGKVAGSPH